MVRVRRTRINKVTGETESYFEEVSEGGEVKREGAKPGLRDTTDPVEEIEKKQAARSRAGLAPATPEQLTRAGANPQEAERISGQQVEDLISEVSGAKLPSSEFQEDFLNEKELQEGEAPGEVQTRTDIATDKLAQVGLAPGAFIGNKILDGVESITGNKYDRITAADMADTEFGKLLGITGAVAGAGALVYSVGGTITAGVAALGAKLGTALGIGSGAAILGTGFLAKELTGLDAQKLSSKLFDKPEASNIQGTIAQYGEMAGSLASLHTAGGEDTINGLARADQMNQELLILEYKLKELETRDPEVVFSDEYLDIRTELTTARTDILNARKTMLESSQEFDPVTISRILQRMQEKELIEREQFFKNQ